ncbi:MAG TPA: Hpt domain-containing protein [Phycisphaerae bacterium]|nr:Hpt domain-containing protein [Phycisphaerae bacterium]
MAAPDETPLFSTLATDPDMIELVEDFVAALPERVQAVERALQAGEPEVLRRLSHQLKGASGGYGFDVIGRAAAELEDSVKAAASLAELTRRVNDLAALCRRARVGAD